MHTMTDASRMTAMMLTRQEAPGRDRLQMARGAGQRMDSTVR
jgi:hypothetical protein